MRGRLELPSGPGLPDGAVGRIAPLVFCHRVHKQRGRSAERKQCIAADLHTHTHTHTFTNVPTHKNTQACARSASHHTMPGGAQWEAAA